jgi:hypothetical protein
VSASVPRLVLLGYHRTGDWETEWLRYAFFLSMSRKPQDETEPEAVAGPEQPHPIRPPFELFPRTETQAKFVVITLGFLLLGLLLASLFYGSGLLKLFLE